MASTINASNSGSGGLISTGDASGVLALQTGGTTAVTIDTAQNVGIGVTPSAWGGVFTPAFQLRGAALASQSNANITHLMQNTYFNSSNLTYIATDYAVRYTQYQGQHQWYNAPSGTAGTAISFTQAMTLDASGNLLLNTTSASGNNSNSIVFLSNQGYIVGNHLNGTASATRYASWDYNGSEIGFISQNGTTGVTYGTSSDYRLKEDVAPMTGALAKVAQLNPVIYKWKADGSDGQGFIAHELQEIVPEAVTGIKDELDADGNPKYQGIDTSFLVATLTAAIQELKAINDTQAEELSRQAATINAQSAALAALTARVVALEGK